MTPIHFSFPVHLCILFPLSEIPFLLSQDVQILLATFITKCSRFGRSLLIGFSRYFLPVNRVFPLFLILLYKKFVIFLVFLFNLINYLMPHGFYLIVSSFSNHIIYI